MSPDNAFVRFNQAVARKKRMHQLRRITIFVTSAAITCGIAGYYHLAAVVFGN